MSKQIQWFPGHMSKTLREFGEIKADLYFLLLDSRAPESSFIDSFREIINNKRVVVLLTKADLVDRKELLVWEKKYQEQFENAFSISLNEQAKVRNEIIRILDGIKFKSLLPKIVILGAPNVGKSTLLNIITNSKRAKAEDRAGVTKKNDWFQFNKRYWVLDTPGVLQPKFVDEKQGENLAAIGSIKLDILPLHEVSHALVQRLIDKKYIDAQDADQYIKNRVESVKKDEEIIYKNIIKDFQQGRFGKIILD